VIRLPSGWAYAVGSGGKATLGIVREKPSREASPPDDIWQALGLPSSFPVRRFGRLPAFPQYSSAPVRGRMLAVGDAAFAHNPIAGRGLSFALGSALAAATTVASWSKCPAACADAAEYYREYVAAERRQHLAFLQSLDDGPPPIQPIGSCHFLSWQAQVAMTPLSLGGCIRREPAIRLNDGGFVRWLGDFDLLELRALCAASRVGARFSFGGRGITNRVADSATPCAHSCRGGAAAYAVRRRIRSLLHPHVAAHSHALLKQASVAEQSSRHWGWERSLIIAKTLGARPQDVPRSPFWRSNGVARRSMRL
jgi:hypothetical protein